MKTKWICQYEEISEELDSLTHQSAPLNLCITTDRFGLASLEQKRSVRGVSTRVAGGENLRLQIWLSLENHRQNYEATIIHGTLMHLHHLCISFAIPSSMEVDDKRSNWGEKQSVLVRWRQPPILRSWRWVRLMKTTPDSSISRNVSLSLSLISIHTHTIYCIIL